MQLLSQDRLRFFMMMALEEGRKALPECLPNPPVGCVIVKNSEIIARGFTQPPFQNHAEPMALEQLEEELEDAIMFVTLEPCSFHQRTPSCAQEIVRRKVGHVYVSMLDPHPRNQGKGIQILRDAHIQVEVGLLSEITTKDLEKYLSKKENLTEH